MSVIDTVRRTISRHRLAAPDTGVVAAVSGGPDSTALLHILHDLHSAGELQLRAVAHFNHGLRESADADQRYCADLAAALGLEFISERADVRAVAEAQRVSIESAGHQLRTAFYQRAASACGADAVAVGHSLDDQAETFLLRLVRGAGTRGLAGMHPRSGLVIRPLLECRRADLRILLDGRHLRFLQDSTNDDLSIPRNRLRAEVLPLLTDRFNPAVVPILAAEATLAQIDQSHFQRLTEAWIARHVTAPSERIRRFQADALTALDQPVAWRVLHALMSELAGAPVSAEHVVRGWDTVVGDAGGFDAPRHRLQREGSEVVLTGRPPGSHGRVGCRPEKVPAFCRPLPVPGEVRIPEIGRLVTAEVVESAKEAPKAERLVAVVPKDRVSGGLSVRNRRSGDRIRASAGRRKLQDVFVDHKVPRGDRDRVPIVVNTEDRIVWVAGHGIDQDFRVSDPAQAVVVLRLKAVGGSF